MFGHDDNDGQVTQEAVAQSAIPDGALSASAVADPNATIGSAGMPSSDYDATVTGFSPAVADSVEPPSTGTAASAPAAMPTTVSEADPLTSDTSEDELLEVKQQALQQLSSLENHLDDLSPEEEFRITMMRIQASDDPSLIKKAYNAASRITDERTRAHAFLDVINEVNYALQHKA